MEKRRRHSPKQIENKLRDADTMLAAEKSVEEVLQSPDVSEATLSRWANPAGGMKRKEAKQSSVPSRSAFRC